MSKLLKLSDCEEMFLQNEIDGVLINESILRKKECYEIIQKYFLCNEINTDKKIITIEGFNFNLIYLGSRLWRHNKQLLYDLNIINNKKKKYFELDENIYSPYIEYIDEKKYNDLPENNKKNIKEAAFFNYLDNNKKGKLSIILNGKDGKEKKFCIISNYAPFCKNHFVVYSENEGNKALKQIYHKDTLYWIDSLHSQIGSKDIRLFFSPKGAGNSQDALHFQYLKSKFPAFDYLDEKYSGGASEIIETKKSDWPFPGIMARYNSNSKEIILKELNKIIKSWLNKNSNNTFNLLFQSTSCGNYEFYFIFRKLGYNYIKGIKNSIAGYEVGGNIIVENKTDFENFPSALNKLSLSANNY